MTGATAKILWESAVEPARREAAVLRQAQDRAKVAAARFRLMILAEALGALRLALIAQVTRCEDGVLREITSEWAGLAKIASDTGYRKSDTGKEEAGGGRAVDGRSLIVDRRMERRGSLRRLTLPKAIADVRKTVGLAAMNPDERRTKRDSIMVHLAQRLAWEVRNLSARDAFGQAVEVARLAIEIARLRRSAKPGQHLDEAARLLSGAKAAILNEHKRPERERQAMGEGMWAELEREEAATSPPIPFAWVVTEGNENAAVPTIELKRDDGSTVTFARYKTVDGFRRLLRRHATRICTEAAKRLRKVLCRAQPDVERALGILEAHSHTKEEKERCAAVRTAKEGGRFVVRWEKDAAPRWAESLMKKAQAGELRAVDYLDLMKTRELGSQQKTEVARQGRAKRWR